MQYCWKQENEAVNLSSLLSSVALMSDLFKSGVLMKPCFFYKNKPYNIIRALMNLINVLGGYNSAFSMKNIVVYNIQEHAYNNLRFSAKKKLRPFKGRIPL